MSCGHFGHSSVKRGEETVLGIVGRGELVIATARDRGGGRMVGMRRNSGGAWAIMWRN